MLDAVFWIGAIGYVVLGLLGILLAALVLILFLPIAYRVSGRKSAECAILKVRMRWLFGLARASYDYPGRNVFTVKMLCFTVFRFPKNRKKMPDADGQTDEADADAAERVSDTEKAGTAEAAADGAESVPCAEMAGTAEAAADGAGSVPCAEMAGTAADGAEGVPGAGNVGAEKPDAAVRGRRGRIFAKFKKLKYTIHKIYDKIKEAVEDISYYKSLWEREDTQELLRYAYMRIGRVLQNIRPRRFKIRLLYGAESPDITGYLYAIYGMICPHLGHSVSVTPDFTRTVLEGDADIAGHITVFTAAYHTFMLLYDKRLRLLVRRIKAHRAAMEKNGA